MDLGTQIARIDHLIEVGALDPREKEVVIDVFKETEEIDYDGFVALIEAKTDETDKCVCAWLSVETVKALSAFGASEEGFEAGRALLAAASEELYCTETMRELLLKLTELAANIEAADEDTADKNALGRELFYRTMRPFLVAEHDEMHRMVKQVEMRRMLGPLADLLSGSPGIHVSRPDMGGLDGQPGA